MQTAHEIRQLQQESEPAIAAPPKGLVVHCAAGLVAIFVVVTSPWPVPRAGDVAVAQREVTEERVALAQTRDEARRVYLERRVRFQTAPRDLRRI